MFEKFTFNGWMKATCIGLLILFPLVIGVLYATSATAIYRYFFFPEKIVILTGSQGGLYRQIGEQIKVRIESELGIEVKLPASRGSLDNLIGLQNDAAHFALYQPGTVDSLEHNDGEDLKSLTTVANLYSQPLHLIVRRGSGIETPRDLIGKRVQVGLEHSGDSVMAQVLLNHLGIEEAQIIVQRVSYSELVNQFLNDEVDAAMITVGVQAPIYSDLFRTGKCHLLNIPYVDALLVREVSLSRYTIPQGLYRSIAPLEPDLDVETVAQGSHLLARYDVPAALVTELTRIIMSERFQKSNDLGELYEHGSQFAEHKPEFPIHQGARNFYHSEFDVGVFEGWEALYSLLVSFLIAGYLLVRTIKNIVDRNKEHKLDQFVHQLLDIERSQLDMDQHTGSDDISGLQGLLDEVTQLRQQALQEFTAHELNEDRAVDSFIEMCHALNNKINAKLSRQRLDLSIQKLVDAIEGINNTE